MRVGTSETSQRNSVLLIYWTHCSILKFASLIFQLDSTFKMRIRKSIGPFHARKIDIIEALQMRKESIGHT